MFHLLQCSSSVHTLLFLFYILLLLTSSMEVAFSADARRLPLRLQLQPEDTGGGTNKAAVTADKQEAAAAAARSRGEAATEARRALIGSRPPRCERVCMYCGHCEAVQVPIVPLPQEEKARASAVTFAAAMFTYRVDGISNYKPLSWKCRCGGTILDP